MSEVNKETRKQVDKETGKHERTCVRVYLCTCIRKNKEGNYE